MKYFLFFTIFLVFSGKNLLATQIQDPGFWVGDVDQQVKTAENLKLGPAPAEVQRFNDLIALRLKSQDAFNEFLEKKDEYMNVHRGIMDETALLNLKDFRLKNFKRSKGKTTLFVQAYQKSIRPENRNMYRAKQIARLELFRSVRNHWKNLSMTALNVSSSDQWSSAEGMVKEMIRDQIYLKSNPINSSNYTFAIDELGFVDINKRNLSSGRVVIEFNYQNDRAQLSPDAIRVKAKEELPHGSVPLIEEDDLNN